MKKKLRLSRETLRHLQSGQLGRAAGGFLTELSNCELCRSDDPLYCIDTGTCPEPSIDVGCGPIPSVICATWEPQCP